MPNILVEILWALAIIILGILFVSLILEFIDNWLQEEEDV